MMFAGQRRMRRQRRPLWRRLFRRGLIGVLLLLLAAVYFQTFGLPGIAKRALLQRLTLPGWDLTVEELYLSAFGGIQGQQMTLQRELDGQRLRIEFDTIDIGPDWSSLWRLSPRLGSVHVSGGLLRCQMPEAGEEPITFRFNDIDSTFDITRGRPWRIRHFRGEVLGTDIEISGTLTNGPAITEWGLWRKDGKGREPDWASIRRWVDRAQQVALGKASKIRIQTRGDAKRPLQSHAHIDVTWPEVKSKWGEMDDVHVKAMLQPAPTPGGTNRIDFQWHVKQGEVQRLQWRSLEAEGRAEMDLKAGRLISLQSDCSLPALRGASWSAEGVSFQTETRFHAKETDTQASGSPSAQDASLAHSTLRGNLQAWHHGAQRVEDTRFDLAIRHPNWPEQWDRFVRQVEGEVTADSTEFKIDTKQGEITSLTLGLKGKRLPDDEASGHAEGLPRALRFLSPYRLDLRVASGGIDYPHLDGIRAEGMLHWKPPRVRFSELRVIEGDRQGRWTGTLTFPERRLEAKGDLNFDLKRIAPLLPSDVQEDLRKFDWETPPQIQGRLTTTLPDTPLRPDSHEAWIKAFLDHMKLDGKLALSNASFEGVPFEQASSEFSFCDFEWHLPDLKIDRPEGRLDLNYRCNIKEDWFALDVNGEIFAGSLQPLFDGQGQPFFAPLHETQPAQVEGKVYGPWDKGKGAFHGRITLPDPSFQGEAWDRISGRLDFTNRLAQITDLKLLRDERNLTAETIDWDLENKNITFTKVNSQVDPHAVARMIDPELHQTIKPLQFPTPPRIRLNGEVQLEATNAVPNLTLHADAPTLRAWRFTLHGAQAEVAWDDRNVTVTNVATDFYNGNLAGNGRLAFNPGEGVQAQFDTQVDQADLAALMKDIYYSKETQLAGELSGSLTITSGRSNDWQSWNGYGRLRLRDGLVWDIPIFGILSTPLNQISPGLGNSRAKRATASFTIEDGVIHTRDLEIRGNAFGLDYKGSFDLQGNVDARAEAVLLEDLAVVGPIFNIVTSPITKLFVYEITGTINSPNAEPLYVIPKIMLFPFKPLRDLPDLWQKREE